MTTPESISAGRSPRPRARDAPEFLAHVRAGRAAAHGAQGSAAKWTHAAMALAIRSARPRRRCRAGPTRRAVLKIVERVMREGDVRARPGRRRPRARGRPRAAALLAGRDGARLRRARAAARCSRTASSATPTCTAARGGSTSASSPRAVDETSWRDDRRAAPDSAAAAQPRCSTPACRRSRTPPRPRSSAARSSS